MVYILSSVMRLQLVSFVVMFSREHHQPLGFEIQGSVPLVLQPIVCRTTSGLEAIVKLSPYHGVFLGQPLQYALAVVLLLC